MTHPSPEDLPPSSRLERSKDEYRGLLNAKIDELARSNQAPAHPDAPPARVYELRRSFSPLAAASLMLEVQASERPRDRVASNALALAGLCSHLIRGGLDMYVFDGKERVSVPMQSALIHDDLTTEQRNQATQGIARVRNASRANAHFADTTGLPTLVRIRDEGSGPYYITSYGNPLCVSVNAAAGLNLEREARELLPEAPDHIVDDAFVMYHSLAAQEREGNRLLVHDAQLNETAFLNVTDIQGGHIFRPPHGN